MTALHLSWSGAIAQVLLGSLLGWVLWSALQAGERGDD